MPWREQMGGAAVSGATLRVGVLSAAHGHAAGYLGHLRARPDVAVSFSDPDGPADRADRGPAARRGDRAHAGSRTRSRCSAGSDGVVVCSREHPAPRRRHGGPGAGLPRAQREADGHDRGARRGDVAEPPTRPGWCSGWRTPCASPRPTGTCRRGSEPARWARCCPSWAPTTACCRGTGRGSPSRSGPAEAPLADHLVHCTDLIDGLLDQRRYAYARRPTASWSRSPPPQVETGGIVTIEYEQRTVIATDRLLVEPAPDGADLGWADPRRHRHQGAGPDRPLQPPGGGLRSRAVPSGGPSGPTWTPR